MSTFIINDIKNVPRLPKRDPESHKGTFGTAMLIGGSRGMSGAIVMAARAALLGGAGLVRMLVPDVCLETVASFYPELMTSPLACDTEGRISADAFEQIARIAKNSTAIAFGPGLGRSEELDILATRIIKELDVPILLDADALNALASVKTENFGRDRVLTPHPGEFSRLCGRKTPQDIDGRIEAAKEFARTSESILVLKGHKTVITNGENVYVNSTGNPGMATGGSGDVLSGLITAFICQSLTPFEAARTGVFIHGLAGDLAARNYGEISMTAGNILEFIPEAIKKTHEIL